MQNVIKTRLFWILTVFISAVIFWAFLNATKSNIVSTDILLIPRSEIAAITAKQIVANAGIIPDELSFFENISKLDKDLRAVSSQMSDSQKKNYWNDKIDVRYLGQSGFIRIEIKDQNPEFARKLSVYSTRELIRALSQYYNIKTDLDIRIIDGPITDESNRANPAVVAIISLLIGFLTAAIVIKLAEAIEEVIIRSKFLEIAPKSSPLEFFRRFDNLDRRYEEPYKIPDIKKELEKAKPAEKEDLETIEEIAPATSQFPPEEKSVIEIEEEVKTPKSVTAEKAPVSLSKKGAAPDNLPVMAEEDVFKVRTPDSSSEKKTERKDIIKEPTPEEVKERLNKLLSGKF